MPEQAHRRRQARLRSATGSETGAATCARTPRQDGAQSIVLQFQAIEPHGLVRSHDLGFPRLGQGGEVLGVPAPDRVGRCIGPSRSRANWRIGSSRRNRCAPSRSSATTNDVSTSCTSTRAPHPEAGPPHHRRPRPAARGPTFSKDRQALEKSPLHAREESHSVQRPAQRLLPRQGGAVSAGQQAEGSSRRSLSPANAERRHPAAASSTRGDAVQAPADRAMQDALCTLTAKPGEGPRARSANAGPPRSARLPEDSPGDGDGTPSDAPARRPHRRCGAPAGWWPGRAGPGRPSAAPQSAQHRPAPDARSCRARAARPPRSKCVDEGLAQRSSRLFLDLQRRRNHLRHKEGARRARPARPTPPRHDRPGRTPGRPGAPGGSCRSRRPRSA